MSKQTSPRLWLGYAMVVLLLALSATVVTSQFQHYRARQQFATQDAAVAKLKTQQDAGVVARLALERENKQQDRLLETQQEALTRQHGTIAHLSQLRSADVKTLTGLHDELAASHVDNERIARRLAQLESSNAAARNAIGADQPVKTKP
ncbi:MAG: hypothetical protein ABI299_01385 [Rhodanobacter sp.]